MKYFVVSDVHGFFTPLKKALDEKGFDPNNPEHFFISCGDLFDRGKENLECLNFVMSLPKERRVFIRGNHEELLYELISGLRYPESCDKSNGTIDTIKQLLKQPKLSNGQVCERMRSLLHNSKLMEYFSELRDYYQVNDYIFVHGWVPLDIEVTSKTVTFDDGSETLSETKPEKYKVTYKLNSASKDEWDAKRWACGFNCWKSIDNLKKSGLDVDCENKTIVCGHWHTSYAHSKFHNDGREFPHCKENWREECNFGPFVDEGIIGLDACTAFTNMVNVVVLDGNYEEGN